MTLILTRSDVRELLDYDSCISAIEEAFRAESDGHTLPSSAFGTHTRGGGFHVKTAGLKGDRLYYAAKVNANFPDNPALRGLPTVQGVLSLFDAEDGRLLALMDSMEVTAIRTAAATAVAAKHLARPDSSALLILGCGIQGRSQLRALSRVLKVRSVVAWDIDHSLAGSYAAEMSRMIGCDVTATDSYRKALRDSDVVVTCTPSREPLIESDDVRAGMFIAAVGADSEAKQEIAPRALASSKVIVDVLEQCATFGDLHHAIESGAMTRDDVHASLGEVISGKREGRASPDDAIIFDSTGTALEDVAAAAVVYERAVAQERGAETDFSA